MSRVPRGVLGGWECSYERGTPVKLALLTLPLALAIVASFVQGVMGVGAQRCQLSTLLKALKSVLLTAVTRNSSRLDEAYM